ncbi:MAG: phosphomannomutase/phosphoglucomutase [Candidatus Jacksonbacteria bacterium]|nr:phosphomannomutase/phosphoglucomutase [Candidatus Jacksonbacteria bacterium]
MQINPLIYRGYDIRGEDEKDLSPEVMKTIARAYASYLSRRRIRHAVVGCDTRETSEIYKKAVIEGLVESGIHVIDIGVCLTQIMYWAQYHFKTNGGAMITASHNPRGWNGLKLAIGYSDTLVGEEVQDIRKLAEQEDFVSGKGSVTVASRDYIDAYYEDLLKRVEINKKFKVVTDTSNATPGLFMGELLRRVGCEVIEQNVEIDPTFPNGTPDPTEKHIMERVAKRVVAEGADIGFAYDADGDRVGLVDEKGGFIWNDMMVALFAKDVLSRYPNAKIVYNVLCSKAVDDVIREAHGEPVRWITGHSFIKAKLSQERAPFGGELSGHFFFADNFYPHDDGAMGTLRALEAMSNDGRPLSAIIQDFPQYISSPEIKLGVPDATRFELVDKMKAEFIAKYSDAERTEIDGIRLDFPDAMFVVRASQNGGYVTVKFEARTQKRYDELKRSIREVLEKYPEVDWAHGSNTDAI